MANVKNVRQHMDPVTMELGGKLRTLQFDMNAFAELEKRFGSIDKAMEHLAQGRITDIRTILWVGLIHEEVAEFDNDTGEPIKYNITPYQVGSWIKNPMMLQEVSEKLAKAMSDGMPDPENLPQEVKKQLEDKGIQLPQGVQMATVVPTEEEKAAEAEQAKNV